MEMVMVCWLKFLKFVNETLKDVEPNLPKRKMLAIEVLKQIEKEEGHDIEKIERRIKSEGVEGIKRIADELKKKDEKNIKIKEKKLKKKKEIVEEAK
jgi:histidinol dehydrogenase